MHTGSESFARFQQAFPNFNRLDPSKVRTKAFKHIGHIFGHFSDVPITYNWLLSSAREYLRHGCRFEVKQTGKGKSKAFG
ncbi:hypothetical protein Ciccas_001302 [Cichlidogyrus casuarinus]|uniref:Uncharacterized protein n=1 Tax=Cichlidogyrus casuarinus TaxID=1844966 RepID=A0ABD2QKR2_9PLAT